MNGLGSPLAQGTLVVQSAAKLEDSFFDLVRRAVLRSSHSGRSIGPIDPIQPLPSRTRPPELDSTQRNTKLARHGSQWTPIPNRSHETATLTFRQRFFATMPSLKMDSLTCH